MNINHSSLLPQVLAKLFPDEPTRAEVLQILGAYGREDFHREVARVHLGILKVSGSDIEKIKSNTGVACSDFRDLLVEAEYRHSFGKSSLKERAPEQYSQLERKEQDEYRKWLLGILAT